jgi:RecB family endonuclease NucS
LCKNIETIEKGIIFMQRQVEVPGGIVDIIAMDKNNNVCVIEIKIKEDKNLVWQAMHYPEEIKKQWRNRNVRMITIAPDYSEHMLKALRNIDNVEIMEYDIMVSMDKITELNIHKVE